MSGTRTESLGFRPNPDESPDGSTYEASCRWGTNSVLRPCLTGLPMTPPGVGCSSQANCGRSSLRSKSYLKNDHRPLAADAAGVRCDYVAAARGSSGSVSPKVVLQYP